MRRSPWVVGSVVLQVLLGLLLSGTGVFLLLLTRSTEIKQGQDAAETISGLRIAAGIFGPPALLVLGGAYGLWRGKLWGWWFALLADAGVTGLCLYSTIDDGWNNIDWDVAGFTLVPLLATVLLLIPAVRGFYWRAEHSTLPSSMVQPPV
jgi:uncharacterized membrane protein (DUF2068 family)